MNNNYDYELRFYSFVNFYLSPIQHGIQTGHCSVRLLRKYLANGNPFNQEITPEKIQMVERWADSYETYIVLNGGDDLGITELEAIIVRNNHFPWVPFIESDRALKGLRTCIGVILPEYIFASRLCKYDDAQHYKYERLNDDGSIAETIIYTPDTDHYELIEAVKNCRLA